MVRTPALAVTLLSLLGAHAMAQEPQPGVDWPQFRGVRASGVADGFGAPVRWNAETGENILWSASIPGLGHSSPILWGDLVCVTTADSGQADKLKVGLYGDIEPVANETAQRWEVRCLDKTTGAERWSALAQQAVPTIPRHQKSTHANSTLATDGTHLVALFGSEGLYGYDLATGRELWRMAGGGDIPTPTPVVDDGLIFITNAHGREAPIFAINAGASGDITPADGAVSNDHLVWSRRRDGAYMQTPLVYDGLLYNCRDNGVLSVYESRTGRRLYQERIGRGGSGYSASPVAADGMVYFSSEDGSIYVVKAGPEFEVLAENPMGETLMATPALSEGVLYIRTRGHLVAVSPSAT